MSLQPSALSGVEHAPADLFEHTTDCAAHHPGTVDEPPSCLRILCGGSLHMRARACADSHRCSHRAVSRAQASTPALLAPGVVDRTAARIHVPHFALLSAAHQFRRASRSRTCVPAAATASTLALPATAAPMPRPWSNGEKPPFFPPRRTSTSYPTRAVPVCGGAPHLCVTIRFQHICVEADTTAAAEDPIRLH
ncbi:hypothetical protein B0H14DRAFT_3711446 [Mycena olivaceomarginata]|nr:hypothetical protein B0H14DRAFT_3711446 [Mycena olivaceomarginata]